MKQKMRKVPGNNLRAFNCGGGSLQPWHQGDNEQGEDAQATHLRKSIYEHRIHPDVNSARKQANNIDIIIEPSGPHRMIKLSRTGRRRSLRLERDG